MKCSVEILIPFDAHSPGTSTVFNTTLKEFHHDDAETMLFNAVDTPLLRGDKPWCGFVHLDIPSLFWNFFLTSYRKHKNTCVHLFTMSPHLTEYLSRKTKVPVSTIYHPADTTLAKWSIDNYEEHLISCGAHFRNKKQTKKCLQLFKGMALGQKRSYRLSSQEYEQKMTSSLVFEYYTQCAGSSVLVECIARQTPLVVNKTPATLAYLGKEYPLFFEISPEKIIKQAIDDKVLLTDTSNYLLSRHKIISKESFIRDLSEHITYASK